MNKPNLLLITIIFLFITNLSFAQEKDKSSEILWRFTRMVIIADGMITEAHQNKDIQFINLASKYLNYAQGNINKLLENNDTTYVEKSQEIVNVLNRILSSGINPAPQDALAKAILSNNIKDFAKNIFKNKNTKGEHDE